MAVQGLPHRVTPCPAPRFPQDLTDTAARRMTGHRAGASHGGSVHVLPWRKRSFCQSRAAKTVTVMREAGSLLPARRHSSRSNSPGAAPCAAASEHGPGSEMSAGPHTTAGTGENHGGRELAKRQVRDARRPPDLRPAVETFSCFFLRCLSGLQLFLVTGGLSSMPWGQHMLDRPVMHMHFNKMLLKAPFFGENWLTSRIPHCHKHVCETHISS